MKLELPFAILLLAVGGWLWISHFPNPQMSTKDAFLKAETNSTNEQSADNQQTLAPADHFEHHTVQQAHYLEPFTETASISTPVVNEDSLGLLLAQAAKKMELSPPLVCKARCSVNLFEQTITGEGRYFQVGQGSGLTRLELNYQVNQETSFESTQVCDGKFYYWIQDFGGERKIEFLDLDEISSPDFQQQNSPSQWLTRTGTVSLLRNLSSAFEFEAPVKKQLGGHEMLLLRGSWKREGLQNLLHGQINPDASAPIRWERLPKQLPHAVEVFLGTDDFLNLFPYRISFYQYRGKVLDDVPMMTMEFYEVQKVDEIPDKLFQVNANGSAQVDLSGNYSRRLEKMAEAANETLNR